MLKKLLLCLLVLVIPLSPACSVPEQDAYNTDLAWKIAYYQNLFGTWTGDNITEGTTTNLTGFLLGDGANIYTIPDVEGVSGLLAGDQHVLDAEVQAIKLDDFTAPDDNTDLNASVGAHGLLPKLNNDGATYLDGTGGWTAPASGDTMTWLASSVTVLTANDRTTTAGFVDLDLTAQTSASAHTAILMLQIGVDSYTSGRIIFKVRKNGDSPAMVPLSEHSNPSNTTIFYYDMVFVGLDAGQILEYSWSFTGTSQADLLIYVLGYIE